MALHGHGWARAVLPLRPTVGAHASQFPTCTAAERGETAGEEEGEAEGEPSAVDSALLSAAPA